MKIKRITITNYMGIPDLDFTAGTVNILSGQNKSGKTSVLEAVKHVMSHDHDPRRIRTGADFAEVILRFDNGEVYRMKTTKTKTVWDFKNAKGEPITKSDAHIKALVDFLTLDPVEFIDLEPKDQVTRFLQAVPMAVEFTDFPYVPAPFIEGIDLDQHALAVIGDEKSGIYKRVYDERTLVNRIAKENHTAAQELDKRIGDVPDVATAMKIVNSLQEKKTQLERDYADNREEQLRMVNNLTINIEKEKDEAASSIKAVFAARLHKITEERDLQLAAVADKYHANLESTRAMEMDISNTLDAEYKPQISQVSLDLGIATGALNEANRVRGLLQMRDTHRTKDEEYSDKSDSYTKILDQLKALRTKLISSSPIPGLEVTESGLLLNGIPFEITNLAQQIEIALKIGQLRQKGECGIMLIDNLEHFDAAHLDQVLIALDEAAKKCGLQIFGARVSRSPQLQIENLDNRESLDDEKEPGLLF